MIWLCRVQYELEVDQEGYPSILVIMEGYKFVRSPFSFTMSRPVSTLRSISSHLPTKLIIMAVSTLLKHCSELM